MIEINSKYTEWFNVSKKALNLLETAEKNAENEFVYIDKISEYNQLKVLKAFRDNKISESHFIASSGYGYDDQGREALDSLYAQIFGAEDALVRHNIISGTHALSLCFFGVLRPGDTLLSVTGKPYDTIEETIGIRGNNCGSLKDFGINYKQIDLKDDEIDIEQIKNLITSDVKAVLIQRSKGYNFRKTLSVEEIGNTIKIIKNIKKDTIIIVDNCYGEFVETIEPTEVGADLVAGSLIKNPGGSLASTGGYIAGRKDLIELCAYKLNAVGIGKECGATLGLNKSMYQGLYFAPFVVSSAVKTAVLAAHTYSNLGFEVTPRINEKRHCIIQAIKFNNPDAVIGFCEGIQMGAAVDSFVTPTPWDMPGYEEKVIMAAGAFNQGSSIELSADAPIKPPYIAYMQGGVSYNYGKIGILFSLENLIKKGII